MVPTGNRQWRRFWRWPLPRRVLLPVLVAPILAALALAIWLVLPLPPELASPGAVPSLVIEDRHGLTLRTTRAADGSRGGWIPLAEVSPTLLQAFLAAEDHRFFDHPGIDPRAVARAARDNLRARRIVSGASTISMQTARLLRPAPRTWRGKLAQLLWAIRLEARLDKARILEQYLNRVPLGQGAVGVAAGASLYFGADARELSLGQAALLAALAHAPSRDNPLVDPARAATQRQRVLNRMGALGYAGAEELARAATEPVMRPTATNTFLAPHFTTRLLLATAEGGIASPATPTTGTWRTTLDLELQRALEAEVRHSIGILQDRNVRHAAIVVLDNPTGEILAWVGSPDFWADAAGQVDMVASPRQPGSALKPFLFGLAFDRGYTAASVIPDIPRTYQTATGPYQPRNYDRRFRGPVRARVALGSSFNVPSVELAERLGPGAFLGTLRAAGFSSLTRSAEYYGPGLALGNGEVTLIELANGFRGLANGGVWSPVRWMTTPAAGTGRGPWDSPRSFTGAGETRGTGGTGGTRGTGGTGETGMTGTAAELSLRGRSDSIPRPGKYAGRSREQWPGADQRRFLSTGAAALVLDILSDPAARAPGFGTETPFDFPFPAAAKTGTSRHFTDNWAVVTTGRFTVAVWVGNFSGRPMQGVSGISGAGPLIYRATLEVARRYPPGHLPTPEGAGAVAAPVCILSGLRATPECPATIEWFLPGTEPTRPDHWQRGGRTTLPLEYAEWAAATNVEGSVSLTSATGAATGSGLDSGMDSGELWRADTDAAGRRSGIPGEAGAEAAERTAVPGSNRPHRILSPLDGDIYEIPVGVESRYATIPLIAAGAAGDIRWAVDGQPVHGGRWRLEPGPHVISATWANGAVDSVRVEVR